MDEWYYCKQVAGSQRESNNDYGRKMRVKKDEKNVLTRAEDSMLIKVPYFKIYI